MTSYTHTLTTVTDTVSLDATLSRLHWLTATAGFRGLRMTEHGVAAFSAVVVPREDGTYLVRDDDRHGEEVGTIPAIRRALVEESAAQFRVDDIEALLPANYHLERTREGLVVAGHDLHGWTLDGYVLPRLGSGLICAQELTRPVLEQ